MKAGNLPCVVILEILIMKTKYKYKTFISVAIIVIGIIFATINELSFDIRGFITVLISTIISAMMGIYGARIMKSKIDIFNTARLLGLPSIIVLMIVIMMTEINDLSIWMVSPFCTPFNILLLIISGFIAFLFNLSVF